MRPIETTNITVHIIRNQPVLSCEKPRTDVMHIACNVAAEQVHNEDIRQKMVTGLYEYLPARGVVYYGDRSHTNTFGNYPPVDDDLYFALPKFINQNKEWDCKDMSCLYQVCCNSLGANVMLREIARDSFPLLE